MLLLFYKGSNSNSLQTLVVIYLDWVDINGHRSWNTFKYSSVTKMPSQDGLRRLHYSAAGILAWQIPRSEEPSALRPWDHKELDVTEWLRARVHAHTHTHTHTKFCLCFFFPALPQILFFESSFFPTLAVTNMFSIFYQNWSHFSPTTVTILSVSTGWASLSQRIICL